MEGPAGEPGAIRAGAQGSGDTARAAAGLLAVTADVTGNPELQQAADALARAARAPWGRIPAPSPVGQALRTAARGIAATRQQGRRPGTFRLLLTAITGLARAIAQLRAAQRRHLQAVAARDAVLALNRAAAAADRQLTVADATTFPVSARPRRVPSPAPAASRNSRGGAARRTAGPSR